MPKKPRNDLKDRLTAALVKGLFAALRIPPLWACATAASALGAAAAALDGKHRRIMMRQMRLAFGPEMGDAELKRLSRACYRHEVLTLMEIARLPKTANARWIKSHIDLTDKAHGQKLKDAGEQGVLVITGHIGNWELLAHAAALAEFPVTALARPLKNPYLNSELERLRTLTGNRIRHKNNSISEIRRILDAGEWACFIYDQNGGPKDAFIPFFGVPAATWRSASFLQWKCAAPIIVATLSREDWKGARHKLNVHCTLMPQQGETRQETEERVLSGINDAFERAIRAHPEQWIWQHRRWKTRPEGEDSQLVDGVPVFKEQK